MEPQSRLGKQEVKSADTHKIKAVGCGDMLSVLIKITTSNSLTKCGNFSAKSLKALHQEESRRSIGYLHEKIFIHYRINDFPWTLSHEIIVERPHFENVDRIFT